MKFTQIALIAALAGSTMLAQASTPDEAKALLDQAITMIKSKGTDAAATELNAGGSWNKGALYVVFGKLDGTILAHSANNKMAGKNTAEAKDAAGKEFVKENLNGLKAQGHTEITMRWANPATKQIGDAVMFSKVVPGTQTYVSSIVFK
jgi:signal transduction histidine kinase